MFQQQVMNKNILEEYDATLCPLLLKKQSSCRFWELEWCCKKTTHHSSASSNSTNMHITSRLKRCVVDVLWPNWSGQWRGEITTYQDLTCRWGAGVGRSVVVWGMSECQSVIVRIAIRCQYIDTNVVLDLKYHQKQPTSYTNQNEDGAF